MARVVDTVDDKDSGSVAALRAATPSDTMSKA